MSSPVEKIKARLGIAEVVGSYIKLEKSGGNFKACCPFHNEKTPSFYVSPGRESYHCFGCNRGGDIFSFVEEMEGVDFMGALKLLAERAGIELEPMKAGERSANARLHELLDDATKFYSEQLKTNSAAAAYLEKRGIKPETISAFRLGFAPDDWQATLTHLLSKGFTAEEVEKSGLVIKTETSIRHPKGRYYDRFRNRIMFPINDPSGRTIGFSGRTLSSDPTQAKYINTPQTALYDKSTALFGYDKAKMEIKRRDVCILVEGQMDLVMSHQAGCINTVAVSGTALTEQHLSILKRLTNNLVMVFDGDPAGISAARRAIGMALRLDMEVRAALLPDGQDPADVILQDQNKWLEALDHTRNIIDFHLDVLRGQNYDVVTIGKKVTEQLLPYVAAISSSIQQAHYVSKIASFLSMKEEPVWEELKKLLRTDPFLRETASAVSGQNSAAIAPSKTRFEQLLERVVGYLLWQEAKGEIDKVGKIVRELEELVTPDVLAGYRTQYVDRSGEISLQAELYFEGQGDSVVETEELVRSFKEEWLRSELNSYMNKIKQAEADGDMALVDDYLKKCQDLSKTINDIKK